MSHMHEHGRVGCVKKGVARQGRGSGGGKRIRGGEVSVRRSVRRVWTRGVKKPFKKVFGRRDSWVGTFYLR